MTSRVFRQAIFETVKFLYVPTKSLYPHRLIPINLLDFCAMRVTTAIIWSVARSVK